MQAIVTPTTAAPGSNATGAVFTRGKISNTTVQATAYNAIAPMNESPATPTPRSSRMRLMRNDIRAIPEMTPTIPPITLIDALVVTVMRHVRQLVATSALL